LQENGQRFADYTLSEKYMSPIYSALFDRLTPLSPHIFGLSWASSHGFVKQLCHLCFGCEPKDLNPVIAHSCFFQMKYYRMSLFKDWTPFMVEYERSLQGNSELFLSAACCSVVLNFIVRHNKGEDMTDFGQEGMDQDSAHALMEYFTDLKYMVVIAPFVSRNFLKMMKENMFTP